MNRFVFLLVIIVSIFVCSCSDSGTDAFTTSHVAVAADSLPGMLKINASQASVALGTNAKKARTDERPSMLVKFSYDYSMSRHETTCGEFNKLMKPAVGLVLGCNNDSLPATNVSYYDAVLYANERSKAEGFDTAYVYSSAVFDAEKHCTNLNGFVFHPEVQAYRLPTEAEWILAASQNWNPENSWTAENSDYKLHSVCRKNESGKLCDMAGNAMEWVGDWLGIFRNTTVTNYVGAPDGGSLGQRVLKGGSYRNGAASISLYSRGDVYAVVSSTHADYVGFRLAFGAIPDAVWMGNDGEAKVSRVVPLANISKIHSLTNSYKVKLVFRNDVSGNIAFVDYSSGVLSVIEIADKIDSYHPDISPDGRKVAFCTGLEGVAGKSAIYVRDLNAKGSNLVKLDVESATIPRWRVLANGDTVIVYVTDAGNNKEESAFMSQSTWQVKFSNGHFGKPEKLFDGAYHGGVSDDNTLAVSGARLLRARIAKSRSTILQKARDTVWLNGEQACNASLAKDGSKRTLFLDFASKTGNKFVGEKYGTHERLLVADSSGRLIQSVPAPRGYSFDHSEWIVGKNNFAVATLANANGAHTKVVLVNFGDSCIVELAEGDEIWHPCLWIKSAALPADDVLLSLDSAGVYYNDNVLYNALELRVKMENFWKRRHEVTAVGLGSSRMMFGMYEKKVKYENFLNMAYSAGDMRGMYYLFKNYILNHLKKLKILVIEMSPDMLWFGRERSWGPIFDGVPGYKFDENHSFWVDGMPETFLGNVEDCPKPQSALQHPYNLDDFLLPSRGWGDHDVLGDTTSMLTTDENFQYNFSLFKEIVRLAKERNLKIICFIPPQNPNYKKTGSFGVYGPKRSIAEKILAEVKDMDLIWMDENNMGNHHYKPFMVYNRDHLSEAGALILTNHLNMLLHSLQ